MFTINAIERKDIGKGASRRLRNKTNYFPAVVYDNYGNNINISLDHNFTMNLQKNNGFYKETIILVLNGNEIKVKVKEIQRHAFKPKINHIDFVIV
ncbi:50S ribosomal protein L25 [Candidatus Pantoea edessiphila]|uniref:Large ribosomal subunit protein bL25 n=1 Tax=Candidatus Pantoea edessiphila TaxID=2044610 RepID=A0A2P5T2Q7_9GAMM|nr:50S ribosomal protein L25 [Candidatus Pantoea edessiphila]PPI88875.1 50S ribosomal protein L25 [Candidatus Pantoea edessiphila]